MPILSLIFNALSGPILDKLIAPVTDIVGKYINKQITEAQLREQLQALMLTVFKEIEVAHYDAITKIFQSFMATMAQSKIMQRTWAFVTVSQGIMLLWFQFGIPTVVIIVRTWGGNANFNWPSAGSTADWSYALVGALCGVGLLKSGSGVGGALKALIGK